MATPVVFNGVNYSIPAFGDVGYAQGPGNLSSYLIAIASGTLQTTGGLFSLTAPVNFGPNFGVIAVNFTSTTANPATAGTLRLAVTDTIDWRNNANTLNLPLGINGSDQLTFNGLPLSTPALNGTVNAGVAGRLTLYPAAGNTVDDIYVQNSQNIDILIAAQAARSVPLEYTIPNPGNAVAAATFALLQLAQTFTAAQTFATTVTISAVTNQLVLGTTNTVTITSPAPAAPRTYTIPDVLGAADFVMTAGVQSIAGAKTFSDLRGTLGANLAAAGFKITGLGAGSANGDSLRYEQVNFMWGYRRPVMLWIDTSNVDVENNTGTANETRIIWPDGESRSVTENTSVTNKYRRFTITATAEFTSGTEDSGLRSGLSRVANTWYALFAVKSLINAANFVLVGDTTFPTQSNFATLNSRYGTNGWVYLGPIANGDNSAFTNLIVSFDHTGNRIHFVNDVTAGTLHTTGILLATAAAGNFFLTATPTQGTNIASANVPPTVFQGVLNLTLASSTNIGYDLTIGTGGRTPLVGNTGGTSSCEFTGIPVQFRAIDSSTNSYQWHNGTTGYAKGIVLEQIVDLALISPYGQVVAG